MDLLTEINHWGEVVGLAAFLICMAWALAYGIFLGLKALIDWWVLR